MSMSAFCYVVDYNKMITERQCAINFENDTIRYRSKLLCKSISFNYDSKFETIAITS